MLARGAHGRSQFCPTSFPSVPYLLTTSPASASVSWPARGFPPGPPCFRVGRNCLAFGHRRSCLIGAAAFESGSPCLVYFVSDLYKHTRFQTLLLGGGGCTCQTKLKFCISWKVSVLPWRSLWKDQEIRIAVHLIPIQLSVSC